MNSVSLFQIWTCIAISAKSKNLHFIHMIRLGKCVTSHLKRQVYVQYLEKLFDNRRLDVTDI